jgi:hypothetical protein
VQAFHGGQGVVHVEDHLLCLLLRASDVPLQRASARQHTQSTAQGGSESCIPGCPRTWGSNDERGPERDTSPTMVRSPPASGSLNRALPLRHQEPTPPPIRESEMHPMRAQGVTPFLTFSLVSWSSMGRPGGRSIRVGGPGTSGMLMLW